MFSVIIIVIYQVASMVAGIIWEDYVIHIAGQYFAEGITISDYKSIDISKIEKINGFIYIVDEELNVIYVKGKDSIKLTKLSAIDMASLVNGTFESSNGKLYASMKSFIAMDGNDYACIAFIPAEKVQITSTILNVFDVGIEMLGIIFITVTLFFIGYWATVLLLSKQINNKITKPIYTITKALGRVRNGDYNARLELEADNEFVYIRDAFNYMIQELNHLKQENLKEIEYRTRLMSDIGHDIKTPITIIHGYLSAILNGDISDEQKKKEYLASCLNNSNHLTDLMQMLLDYSKFDRADYKLNLKEVEITEFVRKVIIDYYKMIVDNGLTIDINIPDEEIYAIIDEKEMRRALGNIINNGIIHNSPGTSIYVSILKEDNLRIGIADDGKEISDDLKLHIFEPFVCGEASRSDSNHNGLGLSIVRRIIQKHQGRIHIEDSWMGYTKAFIIEIPYHNIS